MLRSSTLTHSRKQPIQHPEYHYTRHRTEPGHTDDQDSAYQSGCDGQVDDPYIWEHGTCREPTNEISRIDDDRLHDLSTVQWVRNARTGDLQNRKQRMYSTRE